MALVSMTIHKRNDFFTANRLPFNPQYIVTVVQVEIDPVQRELDTQPADKLPCQFHIVNIRFKNLYHRFILGGSYFHP